MPPPPRLPGKAQPGRTRARRIVVGTVLALVIAVSVGTAFLHTRAGNASPSAIDPVPIAPAPVSTPQVHLPRLQLPAKPHVMVIGDSWSTGYAAAPGHGYIDILARTFGWRVDTVPDAPNSGWEYPGADGRPGTFASRLTKQPVDKSVDLMFMNGGLNDQQVVRNGTHMDTKFNEGVKAAIALVHTKYPNAKIVVMGPLMPVVNYQGIIPEIDDRLAYEATQERFYYISPYLEDWFSSADLIRRLINHRASDSPNTAGHAYLAQRAAADLRKFMRQRS
jgi:hypothetical protein